MKKEIKKAIQRDRNILKSWLAAFWGVKFALFITEKIIKDDNNSKIQSIR